jgi:hypothetical protein
MSELIDLFLNTNTPWAILFVILFSWYVKQAKEREREYNEKIKDLHRLIRTDLQKVDRDVQIIVELWKTLLTEEMTRRKDEK